MSRGELAGKALQLIEFLDQNGGRADLNEVLSFLGIDIKTCKKILKFIEYCGFYPYTPFELIRVDENDGEISISLARDVDLEHHLDPGETLALLAAVEFLKNTPAGQIKEFERIFEKIEKAFPDLMKEAAAKFNERFEVVFDLPYGEKVRLILESAILRKKKVKLDYIPLVGGSRKTYCVCPYRIYYEFHNFYLWALDESDRTIKCFLCEQIVDVEMMEETFEPEAEINEEIEKIRYKRFEQLDHEKKAKLRFKDFAARFIDEEARFPVKKWLSDNELEVEVPLISSEWVLKKWVLPFAGFVDIVEPDQLRKELKQVLEKRLSEIET